MACSASTVVAAMQVPNAATKYDEKFDAFLEPVRHQAAVQAFFSLLSRIGEFSLVWHAIVWVRAIGSGHRAGQALAMSLLLGAESLVVNQGVKRLSANHQRRRALQRAHADYFFFS